MSTTTISLSDVETADKISDYIERLLSGQLGDKQTDLSILDVCEAIEEESGFVAKGITINVDNTKTE